MNKTQILKVIVILIISLFVSSCFYSTGILLSSPSALLMSKSDKYLSFSIEIQTPEELIVFEESIFCKHDVKVRGGGGWYGSWAPFSTYSKAQIGTDKWMIEDIYCDPDPKKGHFRFSKISKISNDGNVITYPFYPHGMTTVEKIEFEFSESAKFKVAKLDSINRSRKRIIKYTEPVAYQKLILTQQSDYLSKYNKPIIIRPESYQKLKSLNCNSDQTGLMLKENKLHIIPSGIKPDIFKIKAKADEIFENIIIKDKGLWVLLEKEYILEKIQIQQDNCINFTYKNESYFIDSSNDIFFVPNENSIFRFKRIWDYQLSRLLNKNATWSPCISEFGPNMPKLVDHEKLRFIVDKKSHLTKYEHFSHYSDISFLNSNNCYSRSSWPILNTRWDFEPRKCGVNWNDCSKNGFPQFSLQHDDKTYQILSEFKKKRDIEYKKYQR